MNVSKVFHGKLEGKSTDKRMKNSRETACQSDIMYIEKQYQSMRIDARNKHQGISICYMQNHETEENYSSTETTLKGLTCTINGLLKLINKMRIVKMNKA